METRSLDYILNKPILFFIATLACIFLESIVSFDEWFQQPFFQNGEWLISPEFHAKYKWLLYTGVKVGIIAIGVTVLGFLLYGIKHRENPYWRKWIKPSILVILCLALIPLIISLLKATTGVYCPRSLISYGGEYEHIGFVQLFFDCGCTAGGRCFPAGHASGGFALMSLYYLPLNQRHKSALFYIGLSVGWLMGIYQMARGEHFISHTLTTMFMALMLMAIITKLIDKQKLWFSPIHNKR